MDCAWWENTWKVVGVPMGIGRREFLKVCGTALASLGPSATSAVTIWEDDYINRKLGIALRKPPGWHFGNVKEMGELKAGLILNPDAPGLAQELLATCEDPILVITREPFSADSDSFGPGVTVFLEDYNEALEGSHEQAVRDEILGSRAILPGYDLLEEPRPVSVSGCSAYEFRASFLFKHHKLKEPTPVNMRVLSVYQKPALYDIKMYDSPDLGPEYTFAYDDFVASVRLV